MDEPGAGSAPGRLLLTSKSCQAKGGARGLIDPKVGWTTGSGDEARGAFRIAYVGGSAGMPATIAGKCGTVC